MLCDNISYSREATEIKHKAKLKFTKHHISPSQASYEVSCVRIFVKIDCIISPCFTYSTPVTKAYYRSGINRISYLMSEVRGVCFEYYGELVVQWELYVFIIVIMCITIQSMWLFSLQWLILCWHFFFVILLECILMFFGEYTKIYLWLYCSITNKAMKLSMQHLYCTC